MKRGMGRIIYGRISSNEHTDLKRNFNRRKVGGILYESDEQSIDLLPNHGKMVVSGCVQCVGSKLKYQCRKKDLGADF